MAATLEELLLSVWQQSLVEQKEEVDLPGIRCLSDRTRAKGLRTVHFLYDGKEIEGIEQNPETSSQWAKLAQAGKRIMQFRCAGRYVANVCEGKLTRYPAWTAQQLPPG